jgi:hypothetical protein
MTCELVSLALLCIHGRRHSALPAGFDNAHGDGVEIERGVIDPLWPFDPSHRGSIGSRCQGSSDDAAYVIGDYIMVADAFAFAMDAVDELDQFDGLNDEPGFFADFANDGIGEEFANFDEAAGEGPMSLKRLGGALNQQDAPLMDDDCSDTDKWADRKLSLWQ